MPIVNVIQNVKDNEHIEVVEGWIDYPIHLAIGDVNHFMSLRSLQS